MTKPDTQFLDRAYDLNSIPDVRDFYGDWAESYDSNIDEHVSSSLKNTTGPAEI